MRPQVVRVARRVAGEVSAALGRAADGLHAEPVRVGPDWIGGPRWRLRFRWDVGGAARLLMVDDYGGYVAARAWLEGSIQRDVELHTRGELDHALVWRAVLLAGLWRAGEGPEPSSVGHSPGAAALEPDFAAWIADFADRVERLAAAATRGEDQDLVDDPGWYVDTDRGCLEADEPFEPLVRACDGEVVASCPRREDAELIAALDPHLVTDLVPVLRRVVATLTSGWV